MTGAPCGAPPMGIPVFSLIEYEAKVKRGEKIICQQCLNHFSHIQVLRRCFYFEFCLSVLLLLIFLVLLAAENLLPLLSFILRQGKH